jgi:hypothetical protein
MQPTIRVRALLATTVLALVAANAGSPGGLAAQRLERKVHTTHRQIAPGLVYTKIVDERTPRRIFVLRADVASFPITYDVTLAGPTLGYRATVPRMAAANDAIAAVNGDFSSRIVGRPIHAFVEDGTFVQSAGPGGASFAVSKDETRAMSGTPDQEMTAVDSQTGLTWRIDRWNNGAPDVGEIAAFSAAGGSLETPPPGACSLHLTPESAAAPVADGPGFEQTFSIDAHACQTDSMAVGDGVVLSAVAGTDEATSLMSLALGTAMTVTLSLGWTDAYDVMGGYPVLVRDGSVAVTGACSSSVCHVNPRTGIGVQADGRLIIVVVDGRQPKYSVGLTMLAFARLMRSLGAVDAINLDGGGASTMVVKGKVVNRPSDGSLRHVTTAALILPGPDPDEP